MILGRPTNLWLGAFTAVFNVAVLTLAALNPPIVIDVGVVSAVNIAAAAVIVLVANTPPTLNAGDTYHVSTPNGQPDIERVVIRTPAPAPRSTDPPDAGTAGPGERRRRSDH